MARIRSVKPEFWSDFDLAQLTRDTRLLYIALWNQADEHSRLHGDPRWIKGHCFPYDDDLDLAAIEHLLAELEAAGKVVRYRVKGAPYLFLPNLGEHQRLEPDKVASKLPAPDEVDRPTPDPAPPASHTDTPAHNSGTSESRANSSARRADPSETTAASLCSREHVAGSMERVLAPAENGARGRTRDPDPVWDAVIAACGVEAAAMTHSARGACNKAVKELRDIGALPDEIRRRAEHYRRRYPTVALTPQALAKHWNQLHGPPPTALRPPPANPYLADLAAEHRTTVAALEAG